MNENNVAVTEKRRGLPGWLIWGLVLVLMFLLGFIPMWWQLRGERAAHEETQKTLRKAELRNRLTTAIVEARNGEYEASRQNLSDFYTNLTTEIDKGDEGALNLAQRDKLKTVFTNRDNNITLLAQRDPASGERLTDIYRVFRDIIPSPVGATKTTATTTTTPGASPAGNTNSATANTTNIAPTNTANATNTANTTPQNSPASVPSNQ